MRQFETSENALYEKLQEKSTDKLNIETQVTDACVAGWSVYLADWSVPMMVSHFVQGLFEDHSLPSARQHPSYGDCLEVKREYYQNCSMLGCVTPCSQSAAHSCEQFLQVQQIGFVTLRPLRHA